MKKTILTYAIFVAFLQGCSYKPLVDSSGRSGTFDISKAEEITNDIQHCKYLAKENSNFVSNILYWSLSPTLDTKFESIYRKCLTKRGHSVLN